MAATSSRHSTDLLIVGGGPAGCAAAVMAASLGMRSILIEADALCGKLQHIAAVNNVVGGFSSGPELGAAIAKDVGRTRLCTAELGVRATEIRAYDDRVTVTTDTGQHLDAPYVVVATGVGPLPVERRSLADRRHRGDASHPVGRQDSRHLARLSPHPRRRPPFGHLPPRPPRLGRDRPGGLPAGRRLQGRRSTRRPAGHPAAGERPHAPPRCRLAARRRMDRPPRTPGDNHHRRRPS